MWLGGYRVYKVLDSLVNVPWHGDGAGLLYVVPLKGHSTEFCGLVVDSNVIVIA